MPKKSQNLLGQFLEQLLQTNGWTDGENDRNRPFRSGSLTWTIKK